MSEIALRDIVVVDGCRTPFLRMRTGYKNLMSYELGQFAIKGLLDKTGLNPKEVDRVIMGTTISNMRTGNVAREAALGAGIPPSTPCHTVTLACISANQAITSGIDFIRTGQADVIIAGGTDSLSDIPILFNKGMREKLFKAQKLKGLWSGIKWFFSLRPKDFKPDTPGVTEYTTNRSMGQDCERLADAFQVSRKEQDEFAMTSHVNAAKATENGMLANEIVPVSLPPSFKAIDKDNGVRGDTTAEKLGKLRPAFVKPNGKLTAGNSSFLTDGGTAALIMTEAKAKKLGLKPKARIISFAYTGQDVWNELLLGPAYATPLALDQANLKLEDIDVFEYHEAFAGQLLANINALASEEFAKEKLGRDKAVGQIPKDKLNNWGGSLSLGHPFGATGARLLTTAANRLHHENGKYALLAACAGGAHGHAMILEKYEG